MGISYFCDHHHSHGAVLIRVSTHFLSREPGRLRLPCGGVTHVRDFLSTAAAGRARTYQTARHRAVFPLRSRSPEAPHRRRCAVVSGERRPPPGSASTRPHRRSTVGGVDAIQVLGFLVGASAGLFLLITLLVVLPGRARRNAARTTSVGVVWFGGPFRSERSESAGAPMPVDGDDLRSRASQVDWVSLAELSEPGGVGGASAGW